MRSCRKIWVYTTVCAVLVDPIQEGRAPKRKKEPDLEPDLKMYEGLRRRKNTATPQEGRFKCVVNDALQCIKHYTCVFLQSMANARGSTIQIKQPKKPKKKEKKKPKKINKLLYLGVSMCRTSTLNLLCLSLFLNPSIVVKM